MAQDSILGNAIKFLDTVGIYDVVLPFLLVFTIVFAILDKSRIFGEDKVGGTSYPKKNVNALIAFCVAFFVIASSQLVEIITQVSSQMVILLLTSIFFLMLVGSFHKAGEFSLEKEGTEYMYYRNIFMGVMFVGLVLIFLQAIKAPNGQSWLMFALYWLQNNITSGFVSSILVLGGIVLFMWWIGGSDMPTDPKKKKDGDN